MRNHIDPADTDLVQLRGDYDPVVEHLTEDEKGKDALGAHEPKTHPGRCLADCSPHAHAFPAAFGSVACQITSILSSWSVTLRGYVQRRSANQPAVTL